MPAVATEARPAGGASALAGGSAPRLFESGQARLEDVVLRAWGELTADGRSTCPVCGGALLPSGCEDCGTELS
jgi:hypothetical protein